MFDVWFKYIYSWIRHLIYGKLILEACSVHLVDPGMMLYFCHVLNLTQFPEIAFFLQIPRQLNKIQQHSY